MLTSFAEKSLPQAPYVAPIPFCFAGISQSQASNVAPVRRFAYQQRDMNLPAILPKGHAGLAGVRLLWTFGNVAKDPLQWAVTCFFVRI